MQALIMFSQAGCTPLNLIAHVRHAQQRPLPREKSKNIQTEKKCLAALAQSIQPPPRERTNSMRLCTCPTRLVIQQQLSQNVSWCPGTSVTPSHRLTTPSTAKELHNLLHSLTAWDKRQRVGEASNPGPEPPRELYLDRKNGQRDPIRLCTQNGRLLPSSHLQNQALPRRRLVRRRLVSGDGGTCFRNIFTSRAGTHCKVKSLREVHLVLVFPVFLKRRLVAAPLTLTLSRSPETAQRRYRGPCH